MKWLAKEMERRYEILLSAGVRDILSYHKEKESHPPMPYLIVIIDELADLMATYPREVEASIVRLAQMSRAVGIHLVLSTQRPSVEVITGLIKANITSRIALQVASQIDSRTIIDMAGAENFSGTEMLYLAGDSGKPKRIQVRTYRNKKSKKWSIISPTSIKMLILKIWVRRWSKAGKRQNIYPACGGAVRP